MARDRRLRVLLSQIPDSGLTIDETFSPEWVDEHLAAAGEPPPLVAVTPYRLVLDLKRTERTVRVVGAWRGTAETECGRCLEPVRLAIEADVDRVFVPPGELGTPTLQPEVEYSLAELAEIPDVSTYQGTEIDLAPAVLDDLAGGIDPFADVDVDDAGRCRRCGKTLDEALGIADPAVYRDPTPMPREGSLRAALDRLRESDE